MLVTTLKARLTKQDIPQIELQISQEQLEKLVAGMVAVADERDNFTQSLYNLQEMGRGRFNPMTCDHRGE